ncbi:MAG: Pimeloyl-ACP methyl ester carboxylesterase [Chloroflexi bacterium]|nr:MAG: Pimeloyl-ACP methyl ester carboxylesterase [Chloroflexota bacterium]
MPPAPYTIHVPDDAIADLKERLARTRWPGEIAGSGWEYGANLAYVQELCSYWLNDFDWRAQEARLNAMSQFSTDLDGYALHYVHEHGLGPDPLPLIFSHGWPGSIFEVSKILGPLTDPAAHGGDPADAFSVVAPSLPGYGFSQLPDFPGFGKANHTADLWARLMAGLGYDRYGAQGGDWGAGISARLAHRHRNHVVGAHLNMIAVAPPRAERTPQSPEEEAFLKSRRVWDREEAGYQKIQGTKPQTLAYGLTDSPAGLAGWIVEKFRSWSDCHGDVETRFSKDELLTNISIYWFSGTINTSMHRYQASAHDPEAQLDERIETPMGFAIFPAEIGIDPPPRSWVERACNVVHWSEFDRGGHFAALEEPELLVQDIRDFFRPLR